MVENCISFEQGPIRPPSEASSLLLRLTRNCPWNRCLFCPVYKDEKFSRRTLDEIKSDIIYITDAVDKIKKISFHAGCDGEINRKVLEMIQSEHPGLFQIALWQFNGGETVFLQDADSMLMPVSQLTEILNMLKEKLPAIRRITTYARSRTLLRRSVEDLVKLKKAGLSRIHVGLESGNDSVLSFMQKGVSAAQHIEAGRRVKEAGMSLSEYVILGLGGLDLWQDHAVDTARVINEINPDYIRLRTLAVLPGTPLNQKIKLGQFRPLDDDGIVREEALFIETLEGINSTLCSDHILNLLEEINGNLPEDKPVMLGIINRYLSLPEYERELFSLGKRIGYYKYLNDLKNGALRQPVENVYNQLLMQRVTVNDYINKIMMNHI